VHIQVTASIPNKIRLVDNVKRLRVKYSPSVLASQFCNRKSIPVTLIRLISIAVSTIPKASICKRKKILVGAAPSVLNIAISLVLSRIEASSMVAKPIQDETTINHAIPRSKCSIKLTSCHNSFKTIPGNIADSGIS